MSIYWADSHSEKLRKLDWEVLRGGVGAGAQLAMLML